MNEDHPPRVLTIGEKAHADRVEALARLICAEKMGLLQDTLGAHMGEGFWRPYIARAELVFTIINWN